MFATISQTKSSSRHWTLRESKKIIEDIIMWHFHACYAPPVCLMILTRILMRTPLSSIIALNLTHCGIAIRLRKGMLSGAIKVYSSDMPALLYHADGYDPDDVLWGLFRNRTLVRVTLQPYHCYDFLTVVFQFWQSIFTSPKSAIHAPGDAPTSKSSQAKMNGMKTVTPGSIVYAAVMVIRCTCIYLCIHG